MLRKFDIITGAQIFEDYRWDGKLPDLARINVIYGANGTGKTSLAGALDALRNPPGDAGYRRVSLTIEDSGTTRSTSSSDDPLFDRIRVFSERYVDRIHTFSPSSADMAAILTIGERTVEAEKRLETLRRELQENASSQVRDEIKQKDAEGRVNKVFESVSQQVVDTVSRAGGRWRSRGSFSAGEVRSAFAKSRAEWTELSEDDLSKQIAIVNTDKTEALPCLALPVPTEDGLVARLDSALGASPTSIVLDSLRDHPEATDWVDAGRELHAEINICIFCGSPLSEERRREIDNHFSDAVESLKGDLAELERTLTAVVSIVDKAQSSIPSKGLFFLDLRSRYDDAEKELRNELGTLKKWAENVISHLTKKSSNPLKRIEAEISKPPKVSGTLLLALVQEHNERADKHDELVQTAAKAIEFHYLKRAEKVVDSDQQMIVDQKKIIDGLLEKSKELKNEATSLESVDGDPMPSAKVLTREVARLLGRSELVFEVDGGRYSVTRDGQPATGLSAGERKAITLVYFLESVARCDISNGLPIVVIDDPVSSLDSDIFLGVSTYIWTESVKNHIAQLVLLTHNFELFRQWDIQLEMLHKGAGMRATYPANLYEIRTIHVTKSGKTRRSPVLTSWPPSERVRKMVRSTYQHSFLAVVEARLKLVEDDSLENRLDAQLLFPNVIRRMLESFLAFKRPQWIGNFTQAMRNSAQLLTDSGFQGDANALRTKLTRYSHTFSHSEEPSTDVTVNPDEVANAIDAVFEFMHAIDENHFLGLCQIAGVDASTLVASPEQSSSDERGGT